MVERRGSELDDLPERRQVGASASEWLFRLWHAQVPLRYILYGAAVLALLPIPLKLLPIPQVFGGKETLGVQELVQQVKKELMAAEKDMHEKNEAALFALEGMEMEINFIVRAGGDAKLEVVGIDGGFETSAEKIQKLKLHWKAAAERVHTTPRGGISTTVTPVVVPVPSSVSVSEGTASAAK